jgi:hypothetical protein
VYLNVKWVRLIINCRILTVLWSLTCCCFFFILPLSQVGSVQHVLHHVLVKIQQLFLRPTACLTSTLLGTGVGANDYKCSRDQQLNVPSEARTCCCTYYLYLYVYLCLYLCQYLLSAPIINFILRKIRFLTPYSTGIILNTHNV